MQYELVQTRNGLMLANPHDFYIGRGLIEFGEYNRAEFEMLAQLMRCLPAGSLAIEVGANCGSHTLPMAQFLAKQQCRLLAFEPQPLVFQQMCAQLALNGIQNCYAYPLACGKTEQMLYFPQLDYAQLGNFGGISMSKTQTAQYATEAVECVVLDTFLASRFSEQFVGLIKIDVEGFELDVLQGLEKTVARHRPILYVEADRNEETKEVMRWLFTQGYRLWWHTPPLYNPDNFRRTPNSEAAGNALSINVLAVHSDISLEVQDLVAIDDPQAHPIVLRK